LVGVPAASSPSPSVWWWATSIRSSRPIAAASSPPARTPRTTSRENPPVRPRSGIFKPIPALTAASKSSIHFIALSVASGEAPGTGPVTRGSAIGAPHTVSAGRPASS
jgi:hypothetical protein